MQAISSVGGERGRRADFLTLLRWWPCASQEGREVRIDSRAVGSVDQRTLHSTLAKYLLAELSRSHDAEFGPLDQSWAHSVSVMTI